ncbi:MAG: hypothetical protein IJM15_04480 [Erysipelotrichaceae bacterium]|nr:hypothetical protein [Erysipelotrichaceae bacterium]
MGLFDKLLKEGANILNEVTSEENKEKVGSFLNKLEKDLTEGAEKLKEQFGDFDLGELVSEKKKEDEKTYGGVNYFEVEDDGRPVEEKLEECLSKNFPEYDVDKDVSPRELGGIGNFMNYSYVISKDGEIKLIIMLIGKTTSQHREYRWSKEFAEVHKYQFINFIRHFPNAPEYIEARLHKYL